MKRLVSILRLDWLRGPNAKRNWTYVFVLLAYMMLSIALAHLGEQKARIMADLKAENRRLRAQYVETKRLLMQDGLRSKVYNRLKDRGFVLPKRRPKYLADE